jgi:hypothetical protein
VLLGKADIYEEEWEIELDNEDHHGELIIVGFVDEEVDN